MDTACPDTDPMQQLPAPLARSLERRRLAGRHRSNAAVRRIRSALFTNLTIVFAAFNLTCTPIAAMGALEVTPESVSVPENSATLTEAKGTVLKSEVADWTQTINRTDMQPAHIGDKLHEGMQVATAEKSYAQLQWKDVTARAWANSVYSLAPNRRLVYLQSGQLIFCLDKHRKDKREYFLQTNLVQARIRGTTVFCQTDGKKTQISVLEGTIDVLDRRDKSVVRLTPGVIYEISPRAVSSGDATQTTESTSSGQSATTITSTTDLGGRAGGTSMPPSIAESNLLQATAGPPVTIFESAHSGVALYAVNPQILFNQPLVTGFTSQLPSLPLIGNALNKLPAVLGNITSGALSLVQDKLIAGIAKSAQILTVPTGVNYVIGPVVGTTLKLPAQAISYFPPLGVLGDNGPSVAGGIHQGVRVGDLTQFNPSGVLNAQSNVASIISGASRMNFTQGQTGFTTAGLGGIVSGVGSVTNTAGLPIGGFTNITAITGFSPAGIPITSTVAGVVNGVGGTIGGIGSTAGSIVNTTTNTLNQVTGGLTGGLGGLTGGLTGGGGLLGGGFHL